MLRALAKTIPAALAALFLAASAPSGAQAQVPPVLEIAVEDAITLTGPEASAEAVKAAASDELACVAWIERDALGGRSRLLLEWGEKTLGEGGLALGGPGSLSETFGAEFDPSSFDVAVDSFGLIRVAWSEEGPEGGRLLCAAVAPTGESSLAEVQRAGFAWKPSRPELALDAVSGRAGLVWLSGSGSFQRTMFAEGPAFEPVDLTESEFPADRSYPQLFYFEAGALATWYENDGGGARPRALWRQEGQSGWSPLESDVFGGSRFPAKRMPILAQRADGGLVAAYRDRDPLDGAEAAFLLDLDPGAEARRLSKLDTFAGLPVAARRGERLALGWVEEVGDAQGFRIAVEDGPAERRLEESPEAAPNAPLDLLVLLEAGAEPQFLYYPGLCLFRDELHFFWINDPRRGGDGALRHLVVPLGAF